ncbi:MAG: hypothetical protein P1V20_01730 [Verrucomicrobiales bacterium]|nr:hypothetical protein [Verrucomicrobiales bacterium]
MKVIEKLMGTRNATASSNDSGPDGQDMFRVDVGGLRRKFANNKKSFLLFELYQNAVDEDVSTVAMTLEQLPCGEKCHLVVEDDSPEGFKDLTHSYTIFADSSKLDNPEQRGIWNMGEKLVLAFCTEAMISSTRGTVIFTDGRRFHSPDRRTRGTKFEGDILMTEDEFSYCCRSMKSLIPPEGVTVTFNETRLEVPAFVHEFQTTLPTTIGDEAGAIRRTRRKTIVRLYEAAERTGGWIYEMGIPVVKCGNRWHCDVHQRVPLNMQRDNVTPAYLQELRVAVINETHALLEKEDITQDWARAATNDKRCNVEATTKMLDLRFGEKRVSYDVSDREANKKALNEGYTVVSGGSLSKTEWKNAKVSEAIKPAGQVMPSRHKEENPDEELDESKWTPGMKEVTRYTEQLAAGVLDKAIHIRIVCKPQWPVFATYGGGKLTFNLGTLGHKFFDTRTWEGLQTINELLIHEFAHEYASDHLSRSFYDSIGLVGARLARFAVAHPEVLQQMVTDDDSEESGLYPSRLHNFSCASGGAY